MLPRKPTSAELRLQRQNDGLGIEIVKLRQQLATKERYAGRLEYLLRERLTRIDELNGKIDQLRHQNKKLDAEAEHYAALLTQN